MRTLTLTITLLILTSVNVLAQKYLTKTGHINFFSQAPLENIEANSHQVNSILDLGSGDLVFSVLIKSFHFEKALMQEHFNEKYLHSDKYPKSTFKGKLGEIDSALLETGQAVNVEVSGVLSMHGIEQQITTMATLHLIDEKLKGTCAFPITLADYNIKIPGIVKENIAKTIDITVEVYYELYNK